jgi:parallel beta-helix repeat protein
LKKLPIALAGVCAALVLALLAFGGITAVVGANEHTPVGNCGTLSSPGTYEISEDIEYLTADSSFTCIVIGADDITLTNPNNHTITDVSVQDQNAGLAVNGKTGVTVSGLVITGFDTGIFLSGDLTDTVITENDVTGNTISGIRTNSATNATVSNNTVGGHLWFGIWMNSGGDFEIIGNDVSGSGRSGIYLNSAHGNLITSNFVHSNSNPDQIEFDPTAGIEVNGSNNNVLTLNIVQDNPNFGILLNSADFSVVSGNEVSLNEFGIALNSSDDSTISNNIVSQNRWGISLNSADNNSVTDNTVENNIEFGIRLNSSSGPGDEEQGPAPGNVIARNTISNNGSGIDVNSSHGNLILNNNLIDNPSPQISVDSSSSENFYNIGLDWGGNFWSNYSTVFQGCTDADSDGLCDEAFQFSQGVGDCLPGLARMDGRL